MPKYLSQLSRKIGDIANSNNDILASLYKRSLAIIELQESIRLELGPPLNQHLYVANFSPDTIIIFTDSPAWASKLRFHTAGILGIAKNKLGFKDLETVRIRINPMLITATRSEKAITMSPVTTQLLRRVAENINDTKLRTSLFQLSKNN
jgi:hypothetical protein